MLPAADKATPSASEVSPAAPRALKAEHGLTSSMVEGGDDSSQARKPGMHRVDQKCRLAQKWLS